MLACCWRALRVWCLVVLCGVFLLLLCGAWLSMVILLLKHGADMEKADQDGGNALACALAGGHEEVATLLREHGAT